MSTATTYQSNANELSANTFELGELVASYVEADDGQNTPEDDLQDVVELMGLIEELGEFEDPVVGLGSAWLIAAQGIAARTMTVTSYLAETNEDEERLTYLLSTIGPESYSLDASVLEERLDVFNDANRAGRAQMVTARLLPALNLLTIVDLPTEMVDALLFAKLADLN